MEIKINLGDYESLTLAIGATLPCGPSTADAIRTQKRLMREHEKLMSEKIEELRTLWSSK